MNRIVAWLGRDRSERWPMIASLIALAVMLAYPVFAAGLSSSTTTVESSLQNPKNQSCDSKFIAGIDPEFISDSGCPSVLRMVVNFEKIDVVETKKLTLLNRVYPDGDLGMLLENGGVLHESAVLSYDGMGQTNTLLPAGSWTTGKSALVNLHNVSALSNYPFDTYSGDWAVIAQSEETGTTLPVWIAAEPVEIAGFDVNLTRNRQPEDIGTFITLNPSGVGSIHYEIQRSSSDKFQAIFLVIVLIISLLSASVTSYNVVRANRPASLGLIGWLATFLFSVIGLRTTFPGNPPVGINLDKFVTFPVIAMILTFIVLNAYIWLRRDDWDMGNKLPPAK